MLKSRSSTSASEHFSLTDSHADLGARPAVEVGVSPSPVNPADATFTASRLAETEMATMSSRTTHARNRLWEYHPCYSASGYTIECASFAELREYVDASDEDMNRIYRWDRDGDDRSTQTFSGYAVDLPDRAAQPILDG